MTDFKDKFEELFKQAGNSPDKAKVREFFKLMEDLSSKKHKKEEPCPDDDCGDLLSECCDSPYLSIFGTIPLQVKCSKCEKTYILRELLNK